MRFLADESCDACMIRTLRAHGHDVIAIAEERPGATDTVVIALAAEAARVLLTEAKDFGQLVYASNHKHGGVIFLRYPHPLRQHIAEHLARLAASHGPSLTHAFTVIEPGRIRILPD